MDMRGFVGLARELRAECIELHGGWLERERDDDLRRLREEFVALAMTPIVSTWLTHVEGETLERSIHCAALVGASVLRLHLTPVLEGDRAAWGERWRSMARYGAAVLIAEAPRAEAAGIVLGIEDHQDFGSEELVELAETAGPSVGIVFDTGNPFAVGEDPVAFATRTAARVRHVHLKDYRAQFTDRGYRLVRCAIGDGSVPFGEIAAALRPHHESLTASIEPGALEARHIRLFDPEWWHGYPPRQAHELATALGRLQPKRLTDDVPAMTPWERGSAPDEILQYEMNQIRRSMQNVREAPWLTQSTH
jgi:sugar phosphate isomerase/epimerase